ncbi:glucosyltransferase domain-containing protein, partial [Candidatus Binatia bacterium]|nr:glucosyltransferase domain-containing protein [Candidatus Binatia bacterium]
MRGPLTPTAFALAWLLVLVAYGFQGIVPAFNADDVMQMQNPHDVHAILAQGRWGYAWLFGVVQDSAYLPLLSTAVGALLLCCTAAIAAAVLGFELTVSRFAFVVVASVSAYYGELFSYDSTRVAVPLGNLAAVLGLAWAVRGRRVTGTVVMALAPAFYPAASELAATVLVAYALRRCARRDAP